VDDATFLRTLQKMAELNRAASHAMLAVGVHAATDVTGFGLLGHLWEMLAPGGHGVELHLPSLPLYDGAQLAAESLGVSGPMRRNLALPGEYFHLSEEMPMFWTALLTDPQTSGGLLMAVNPGVCGDLLNRLRDAGESAALIGEVRGVGNDSDFQD
jgi:selenide,water dikinase